MDVLPQSGLTEAFKCLVDVAAIFNSIEDECLNDGRTAAPYATMKKLERAMAERNASVDAWRDGVGED